MNRLRPWMGSAHNLWPDFAVILTMMQARLTMLCLALTIGLFGCTYDDLETLGNPVDCDTFDTTYGQDILPLVTENCQGCHSGGTPAAGIAFEEHADIALFAEAMLGRMELEPGDGLLMPPSGKLDSCSIARFTTWIDAGKPDN